MTLPKRMREVLLAHPDGVRRDAVAQKTGASIKRTLDILRSLPGAYVDRWELCPSPRYWEPVYMLHPTPEDCPRPEDARNPHKEKERENRERIAKTRKLRAMLRDVYGTRGVNIGMHSQRVSVREPPEGGKRTPGWKDIGTVDQVLKSINKLKVIK